MDLRHIFLPVFVAATMAAGAVTLDEAREMYRYGDFAGALPTFQEALKSKPKDPALNQWVGVCLLMEGRPQEALPYLKFAHSRNVAEAPRYLAEIAFDEYRFDDAREMIEAYEKTLRKSKKQLPDDMVDLRRRIALAEDMLDRVEKIVVIDSLHVDRDTFFEAYKLPKESGSINTTKVLPKGFRAAFPTTVFMPESKEYMIWAAPGQDESFELMQSARLVDGTWEEPHALGSVLSADGGDSNYPFMQPDGVTLYYANDGDGSIGGYDIFITRRDEDGFLAPQNLGMPYNSPYDDYLLAIDEQTGIGWWATDRNQLGDMITIYRFIPSDLRENLDSDNPHLLALARLTDLTLTHRNGENYYNLLHAVGAIGTDDDDENADFHFALPGGKVLTTLDDFKSPTARKLMERYQLTCSDFEARCQRLAAMRQKWHAGDHTQSATILAMEKEIERNRDELRKAANEIIKAETNTR